MRLAERASGNGGFLSFSSGFALKTSLLLVFSVRLISCSSGNKHIQQQIPATTIPSDKIQFVLQVGICQKYRLVLKPGECQSITGVDPDLRSISIINFSVPLVIIIAWVRKLKHSIYIFTFSSKHDWSLDYSVWYIQRNLSHIGSMSEVRKYCRRRNVQNKNMYYFTVECQEAITLFIQWECNDLRGQRVKPPSQLPIQHGQFQFGEFEQCFGQHFQECGSQPRDHFMNHTCTKYGYNECVALPRKS